MLTRPWHCCIDGRNLDNLGLFITASPGKNAPRKRFASSKLSNLAGISTFQLVFTRSEMWPDAIPTTKQPSSGHQNRERKFPCHLCIAWLCNQCQSPTLQGRKRPAQVSPMRPQSGVVDGPMWDGNVWLTHSAVRVDDPCGQVGCIHHSIHNDHCCRDHVSQSH